MAAENALEAVLLGQSATDRTRSAVIAEFGNPTAQEQAVAGFEGGAVSSREVEVMGSGTGLVRAKALQHGQGGQVETPLGTMAGLLLGSPEFQRR